MPSAIKILLIIPYCFFHRLKSLSLQKYSSKKREQYFRNTLRAWHRNACGSFVLFAPPFCEVGFQNVFRGKTI